MEDLKKQMVVISATAKNKEIVIDKRNGHPGNNFRSNASAEEWKEIAKSEGFQSEHELLATLRKEMSISGIAHTLGYTYNAIWTRLKKNNISTSPLTKRNRTKQSLKNNKQLLLKKDPVCTDWFRTIEHRH